MIKSKIKHRPLVAILRGVEPHEVEDVARTICAAGITILEVTMNSPRPFESIAIMADSLKGKALIGAGTVTNPKDVEAVHKAGGSLIISPNTDVNVINRTKELGLKSYPGCQTPTECFSAIKAGADVLKIFPAGTVGPSGIKAIRAVLPKLTEVYAVGGVNAANMSEYAKVGVTGFGIGSALYDSGKTLKDIHASAVSFVKAWDAL